MKQQVEESHFVLPFSFARHRNILLPYFSLWFGIAGLEEHWVRTLGRRIQSFLVLLCLSRGEYGSTVPLSASGGLTYVARVSLPDICFPRHTMKIESSH